MASIASTSRVVVGGIDTHKDLHVAAVVDTAGVVLGTEAFSTTRAGYRALVRWMRAFGEVRRVGIEGTGSYGAGITRHLATPGSRSSRSTGPTAPTDDGAARATPSTPRTPPAPRSPGGGPRRPRAGWPGRVSARAAADPVDRGQDPAGGTAAPPQPDRLGARGAARPGPRPHAHAAHPDLRRLAPRQQRLPRPRGRHPDRPAVAGPAHPRAQRRGRRARRAHRPLVRELAPRCWPRPASAWRSPGSCWSPPATTPSGCATRPASPCSAAPPRCLPHRARPSATGSTGAATARPTAPSTGRRHRIRMDERTKAYVARRTADGRSKLEIIRCLKRYARP